jgi:hypothetical protein
MRYTDKDMDVIRNHAKLSGDDVTEELAKMRLGKFEILFFWGRFASIF